MRTAERSVRLLEVDPDLGVGLASNTAAAAERALVAPAALLRPGQEGQLETRSSQRDLIGLLVLEGVMLREVEIAGTGCAELIGAGDLVRPGDVRGTDLTPLRGRLHWTLLGDARVAMLDQDFLERVGPWPQVLARIALRAVWRTHGLAVTLAISHQPRVDDRLLLLFWHLAQRWGRVGPGGVQVDLPLTHTTLGKLVGARRPTVTAALGQLTTRGFVRRESRHAWVLPLPIPDELESLLSRSAAARNAVRAEEPRAIG